MAQYRSKLVQAVVALVLLIVTTSTLLWPSLGLGASAPRALAIALAGSPTSAVCPTPGNNSCITSVPTVSTTLNGTDQTVPYNVFFTINSVSGNWHVTFALTQFTTTSLPHRTLSTASTITGVTILSSCSGSTCPQTSITYPVSVTAGNSAITFFNNTAGGSHGVGTFTLQASTNVMVQGNSYAGTYTSTITIAFVSGSP